jgi:hypothetical protein
MSTPEMHRSKRPGWLPSNLLLLAGTVLIGMFLLLLSDLFREDEARSTGVMVVDAVAGMLFYGILMYVSALPGGIGYLLLLEKVAQRVSGMRLRALALVLSPIVAVPLLILGIETWLPLVLALLFGAIVRLPKQEQPTAPLAGS